MNPTTAFLNSTSADALVLFALRVGGLVLVAPVFSSKVVPMTLRSGLIVLFTWLLAPVVIAKDSTAVLTPTTAMTETLIGFALGVGAAVFVGAAEAMGELLSLTIGLSGAATLDPMTFASVPVLGQFANLMVVALLLASNAHHLMLQALAASVQAIPVGGAVQMQAGLAGMIGLGSTLFLLGLRFAALGVVEFIDFGGCDILHHASREMSASISAERYRAPAIVDRMMEEGKLGLKTGSGFYAYEGRDVGAYRLDVLSRTLGMLRHAGLWQPPADRTLE